MFKFESFCRGCGRVIWVSTNKNESVTQAMTHVKHRPDHAVELREVVRI